MALESCTAQKNRDPQKNRKQNLMTTRPKQQTDPCFVPMSRVRVIKPNKKDHDPSPICVCVGCACGCVMKTMCAQAMQNTQHPKDAKGNRDGDPQPGNTKDSPRSQDTWCPFGRPPLKNLHFCRHCKRGATHLDACDLCMPCTDERCYDPEEQPSGPLYGSKTHCIAACPYS